MLRLLGVAGHVSGAVLHMSEDHEIFTGTIAILKKSIRLSLC